MPLFGNRVVVATANYKHIKEKKKDLFDRETRLGRWVAERKERKEKLKELQVSTKESVFELFTIHITHTYFNEFLILNSKLIRN